MKEPAKGIQVIAGDAVRQVTKPWGWEKWLADGAPTFPYALKIIHVRAPHKTSLQFHRVKQESTCMMEGRAFLHFVETPIDVERYARGGYADDEIEALLKTLQVRELNKGDTLHVMPGHIHRIEARDEDVTYVEASTIELDDVFRLQDDSARRHGHIESEHK